MHKALGNYAKATQYLSEVIKASPSVSLLGNRADCYLMMRRLNEASEDIANALQVAPDDGYLYLLRARLNRMRYENEAAKRDVQLAIDHGIDPAIAKEILQVAN
jgi:tetratricopeptide (TPR) repeat protein